MPRRAAAADASRARWSGRACSTKCPDLVEYPVVASGSFPDEFLSLPEEVLTTTMIHHQHFFPIASDQGKLLPVFLAVLNMEPEQPEVIVAQHGARADGAPA